MRSRGFTLLEVLFSILLLFTMGMALLKFDGWIKQEMERSREKARLLYSATPLLYANIQSLKKKRTTLYDATRFMKLRDDEIFWLKNLDAEVAVGKERRNTLFESGDLSLTYRTFPLKLQRGDTAISFFRVLP